MPDTLNPARLERARQLQLRHLPSSARLLQRTAAPRNRGAAVYTWAPVDVAPPTWAGEGWPNLDGLVPVRLSAPTRAEVELAAERWGANPVWTVTAPWGAPVAIGDRLEVSLEGGAAELVQVLGIYTAGASYATALRAGAGEAV